MALMLRSRTASPRQTAAIRLEQQDLKRSIEQTTTLIRQAYACFNSTDDADLIRSYVFEINSLQARYDYLLRRLKQLGELS